MIKNRTFLCMRILQILIGFVLFITAVGKLLDNRGFATVLNTYQTFNPDYTLALGLSVSLIELFLAAWLFLGSQAIVTAAFALLMHIAYTLWSFYHVRMGLKIDNCGCFGVFWARPLGMATVYEDLFMTILCSILLLIALKIKTQSIPHARKGVQ
ncbi:MAG: hypothetical protein H7333_09570 [Bdellovibrionales bacterium]|nr:hypothetical protein [Oligoflexia bacterium]